VKVKSKKEFAFLLLIFMSLTLISCEQLSTKSSKTKLKIKLGAEVFLDEYLPLVEGKNVGLVTNPSAVDQELNPIVNVFYHHPAIKLVALYGPEHGVRGNAQAGEYVPFYFDQKYELPVFSLYGPSRHPSAQMLSDIDSIMRSFDTIEEGKTIQLDQIQNVEVLIFDIQDIGTRVYTYIATMAYCLEACAEAGIKFIVLDRPNPINGVMMEGPLLDYPQFSSFVGLYPLPLRHGMTVGELALYFNDNFLEKKADLQVIPLKGWSREIWFDETSLPWVMPSPNMPTLDTATVYPGQVFLEGTNISEGRGTTRPFELFGAPWIDGYELANRLNSLHLPGVKFREAWFTPTFSKYKGELCGGCQIHVVDRNSYRPLATSLWIINTVKEMYPGKFSFYSEYFDKIMGTERVRLALEDGQPSLPELIASFEQEVARFAAKRRPYLLY